MAFDGLFLGTEWSEIRLYWSNLEAILIKLVDDYGNPIIYANDTFTIDTEGPIEIIGPKVISLIGGSIGFWVKTKGSSGIASIILTSERFGILKEKIVIEKNDPIK